MSWSETSCMEQRARFVLDALQGVFTMSELCHRYGVSRKTGYSGSTDITTTVCPDAEIDRELRGLIQTPQIRVLASTRRHCLPIHCDLVNATIAARRFPPLIRAGPDW